MDAKSSTRVSQSDPPRSDGATSEARSRRPEGRSSGLLCTSSSGVRQARRALHSGLSVPIVQRADGVECLGPTRFLSALCCGRPGLLDIALSDHVGHVIGDP